MWKDISEKEKQAFNLLATHPLQSFAWGEFRKITGVKVVRRGFWEGKKLTQAFQLTIHKIPHTSFTIGYLPKGTLPTKELVNELKQVGKENNCIFIQLEPNVINAEKEKNVLRKLALTTSAHPLFTKYTFQLDLTKSEEDLLKQMHSKTRYNIKVAQKHNVTVQEENSDKAFEEYWQLTKETTTRQGFYAHTASYHKKMWETLGIQNSKFKIQNYSSSERSESSPLRLKSFEGQGSLTKNKFLRPTEVLTKEGRQTRTIQCNELTAHLLIARYNKQALTTWILFVFHDTLYYPYGASSSEHRETMASNLQMWEAIKFGRKLGLKTFDMWGSLGESPDTNDPWYGFHRFKQGYGPRLVEFVGSYDLVINPMLYQFYKLADRLRWILLKFKK